MSYRTIARRRFNPEWIQGQGRFALVAPCGSAVTVTLHDTQEQAQEAKGAIDGHGCGGNCWPSRHFIKDLDAQGS